MAIVSMNQFTLLTFHNHREKLLKELQKFGDVQLRTLGQQELSELPFLHPDFTPEHLVRYEGELDKVRFAMSKLAPYVEKSGGLGAKRQTLTYEEFDRYTQGYDYGSVCQKVKEQDEAAAAIRSEIARRKSENDNLSAWSRLDVSPGELDQLSSVRYLIGTVNRQASEEFTAKLSQQFDTLYMELLDAVKEDVALLLLMPAEQYDEVFAVLKDLGFSRASFQFDGIPVQLMEENAKIIDKLHRELDAIADNLRSMAGEHAKLQIAVDYFNAVLDRERACQSFLSSETVLMVEGWVPAEDSGKLRALLDSVCGQEYYLEESEVERDSETVPIKLKNNKFVSAFEDITVMYSLPKYNEVDPTPILTPFYWVFFGMMVGDVGYGILLVIGTFLAMKLLDLKEGMQRFMKFFFYLGFAVIAAGFLYGSIFGVTFFAPVPLEGGGSKAILDSELDIVTMLVLSIVLGVIHVLYGLCVKAYMSFRDGKPFDAFCDAILWMITLISGIGWLVSATGLISGLLAQVCMWVFWASVAGLALTQGRESPSIGGKIGNGLYGVYGLTSYVGDLVSYTRIVALALSGAYIAFSFNLMGGILPAGIIRVIGGAIIIVFGQTLNLGLALLGAYVHTCRLQYVEFFGKFYEGGGRPFAPLKLKSEFIHIKK